MTEPRLVLEAEGVQAVIDLEHGGRLASLLIEGWELLATEGIDTIHWGSYIVAPWTGRLRNGRFLYDGRSFQMPLTAPPHALHGLVVDRPWHVLAFDRQSGEATMGVELEPPWPWHGRLVHSMRLGPDGLLSRLELVADEPMPAAMGWHPWFATRPMGPGGRSLGPLEIDVQPGRMYAHDEEGLPNGMLVPPAPRPWDFCFADMAHAPRLAWPDGAGGGVQLTVESDCPCWIVYDMEPQAVAVEPWTAPPNSLNLPSPTIAAPGQPLTATMTWRWSFT